MNTVHFKISENTGYLLMKIAQEHLIYNLNPHKAITTITDSLEGIDITLALEILS